MAKRKSAFLPYKPHTTVLTNLQRGNTEANSWDDVVVSFHERAGQGEISEEQIKTEASPDILDLGNFTPLHWACYYGQTSSATALIACGADVNKLAPDLVSPLLLAASGGYHEIVRLLLQKEANVNHMDIVGNTALMFAAAGNHPHTCNELLAYNPNLMETNENGDTAYSLAIQNNANLSQAVLENYLVSLLTM